MPNHALESSWRAGLRSRARPTRRIFLEGPTKSDICRANRRLWTRRALIRLPGPRRAVNAGLIHAGRSRHRASASDLRLALKREARSDGRAPVRRPTSFLRRRRVIAFRQPAHLLEIPVLLVDLHRHAVTEIVPAPTTSSSGAAPSTSPSSSGVCTSTSTRCSAGSARRPTRARGASGRFFDPSYASPSSSARASWRSAVSKPSVNQA